MKLLIKGLMVAMMCFAGTALADEYPDRPLTLMVSYGAGGATDTSILLVGGGRMGGAGGFADSFWGTRLRGAGTGDETAYRLRRP